MDQISLFNEELTWRFNNESYVNKYYVIARLWNGFWAYFTHYNGNDWPDIYDMKDFGVFKTLKEAKRACQEDYDLNSLEYDMKY